VADIKFLAYDLLSNTLLAELPVNGATWSDRLNGGGSFSGLVSLSETGNPNADYLAATLPGRTVLHVVIDGTIRWSGVLWSRSYSRGTSAISITGTQLDSLLDKVIQVTDFAGRPPGRKNSKTGTSTSTGLDITYSPTTKHWVTNPVPPIMAVTQLVGDTLKWNYDHLMRVPNLASSGNPYGATITAHMTGGYPAGLYRHNEHYPMTSRASLLSILSSAGQRSIRACFDFAYTATLSSGTPAYNLDLYWPRMGFDSTTPGATAPGGNTAGIAVIDGADVHDYSFPEDASSQVTRIFGSSGSQKGFRVQAGDFSSGTTWDGSTGDLWFHDSLPAGTDITVYGDGSTTAYTGTVRKTTYGGIFGYRFKIAWSSGAPTWSTTALKGCSYVVTNGPSASGYPPLEATVSYSEAKARGQLFHKAFADLTAQSWPVVTPTVTVSAFGPAGIGVVNVGDDIQLTLSPDDRFMSGLGAYWRVVQADYAAGNGEQVTATYTLNVPPNPNLTKGGFPAFPPTVS
jgi:hypothetical protein